MHVLHSKTGELALTGSAAELYRLAEAMRSTGADLTLDTTVDPAPYDRALSSLTVRRTDGKVIISLSPDGGTVEIVGGADDLDVLAANLDGIAEENDSRHHQHIEYFPDHYYLGEGSMPIVVSAG